MTTPPARLTFSFGLITALALLAGCDPRLALWPSGVRKIAYRSADSMFQPALFYSPGSSDPRPLLVAFHTWSSDYTDRESVAYATWCIDNAWILVHPDLRGPNNGPRSTGSDLVVADTLAAVQYAQAHANVDASRIYSVGMSGGGYTALLLAGRAPHLWAGVSAWAPITDLSAWYFQARARGFAYARDIERACGGVPEAESSAWRECTRRSPLTHLASASAVPIDLNVGVHDGTGSGSVPITHSILAFNLLARPQDRISQAEIEARREAAPLATGRPLPAPDPLYEPRRVLFRQQSANVRLTVFEGGHEMLSRAALSWLAARRKGDPL
jgi:acetyl esterase/lipase